MDTALAAVAPVGRVIITIPPPGAAQTIMTMTPTADAATQPIRVFQDLLDILAGNPQLADLMRQHLLTQELLNLPQVVAQIAAEQQRTNEIVAQLAADLQRTNEVVAQLAADLQRTNEVVAQLAADLQRTNEVVAQLAADLQRTNEIVAQMLEVQRQHTQDIAELKTGVADLQAGQARMETRLDDLAAKFLYLDARKMTGPIADKFNIRRPVWLENNDLVNIVDDAGELADAIPRNELASLLHSDLAIRATDKSDRQTRYILIECTGSITRNDVNRIRRNAGHLARLTCHATYPLIIGKLPPDNILREAESSGVHCLQPGERITRVD